MSAYMVPLQATLLERPLAVASTPSLDRRIVMYSGEGTELGTSAGTRSPCRPWC